MRRNYILYLEDILASANKIQNYVGNASFEELIKKDVRPIESSDIISVRSLSRMA